MNRFGTATSYAEVQADREIEDFARHIASIAAVSGSLNVQLARDSSGRIGLFEINPRFSALVSARALAGFCDVEWWARGIDGSLKRPNFEPTLPLRVKRYLEDLVDQGGGFRSIAKWR
jgi:predicted ATP-grasp superfamily ATP-dependent carboligase